MATYNFITLDNGGVSVLVDGKYQNTFFQVVSANYVNGNLNVSDSLGYKFSFNIDNAFEISGVAVVGNATVKCEAIVAVLPTTLGGTVAELDPVFSASTAHSITPTNVANWNSSFGWGNHASAGYLTSSAAASTYQPIGIYLTSYTETDPVFLASTAHSITPTNVSNWNSAYGWGNHASAGYLTSINSSNVTTALGFTPYNSSNPSGYLTASAAASTYQPIGSYLTSITSGNVTSALGFTPYNSSNPSGYISSYTETDPIFVSNGLYKNGVSGGQTFKGGTGSAENATISSTNHTTKGKIILGISAYDEANNRLGIGTASPSVALHVLGQTNLEQGGNVTPIGGGALMFNLTGSGQGMCITNQNGTSYRIGQFALADTLTLSYWNLGSTGLHINSSNRVGFGITPTAKVHIAAGTATANTAPVKLTAGTNLTTAETGSIEYNGTNLFFTRTGTTRESIISANSVNSVSPTSPNRTITVVIDGVTLYLSAKTTND